MKIETVLMKVAASIGATYVLAFPAAAIAELMFEMGGQMLTIAFAVPCIVGIWYPAKTSTRVIAAGIGMLIGLVIWVFFASIIIELHNNYVIVALMLSILIVPGVVAYGICRNFAAESSDG